MARDHIPDSASLPMQAIQQADVPRGRTGKHKHVVTLLLNRLNQLPPGKALKIPLAALPDTKANIRSALHRAARQKKLVMATSSDSGNLYIWKVTGSS